MILDNLQGENIIGLLRELKIDSIFRADALIMDDWGAKFYRELNPLERELRKELGSDYGGYSTHHPLLTDPRFKKLTSMSEALISLMNRPRWMDYYVARQKLKFQVDPDEQGKFQILIAKSIEAIIKYFDNSI
jgi:hypothetical protein